MAETAQGNCRKGRSWPSMTLEVVKKTSCYNGTSSPAVTERPRDASCPSVVSFNDTIPRAQSFRIVTSTSDLPLRTIKCCSFVFCVFCLG